MIVWFFGLGGFYVIRSTFYVGWDSAIRFPSWGGAGVCVY